MTICPKEFFDALKARGVDFYAGVPDSLLANFCAYVDDESGENLHVIAANEGNAVAVAMGYHMATGKVAAVYMQNSGLGNAINPLASLVDAEVYKVPMLLVIGWRGEPGVPDEPQHVKQGRITLEQLDLLGVPYWVLESTSDINTLLDQLVSCVCQRNAPVALVVRKDTFAKYSPKNVVANLSNMSRETALDSLLRLCSADDLVIATTGKLSREVYELRVRHGQKQRDFLTVGGMGHASSIALGVAIAQPARRVVCFDGDGSLLMHMGSLAVVAAQRPRNFVHVLLNNGAHESVGGQPTSAGNIDFSRLVTAVGYKGYAIATDPRGIQEGWNELTKQVGPVLLEVKIKIGSRADLGRPTTTAEQNKHAFMEVARG
jgi:phosphonopyruvate decarboxylase